MSRAPVAQLHRSERKGPRYHAYRMVNSRSGEVTRLADWRLVVLFQHSNIVTLTPPTRQRPFTKEAVALLEPGKPRLARRLLLRSENHQLFRRMLQSLREQGPLGRHQTTPTRDASRVHRSAAHPRSRLPRRLASGEHASQGARCPSRDRGEHVPEVGFPLSRAR